MSKKRVSVTLSGPYLVAIGRLVKDGLYLDRGEAVRDAFRHLFRHYGIEPFVKLPEGTESTELEE